MNACNWRWPLYWLGDVKTNKFLTLVGLTSNDGTCGNQRQFAKISLYQRKKKKSTDKIIEKERKDNAHTFSSSKKFVSADIIMAAFFQHMISMLMKFWWPKFRKRVKGCFCFEKRRKNIKKSFSFFPQANSHWHFCSNSWQVFFGICDR